MNLMMPIKDAFANLTAAKLRSLLAILGILVGTGSVVAMVSSGELATRQALTQFKQLGTDLLSFSLYDKQDNTPLANTKNLTVNDIEAIAKRDKNIKLLAPYSSIYVPIAYNGVKLDNSIIGATPSLQKAIKIKIKSGRFLSFLDHNALFCVIGDNVYKKLRDISDENPIGKQIQTGNNYFTIIGVAEPWQANSFFNQNINDAIIIPLSTASIITQYARINSVVARLQTDAPIEQVQKNITDYIHQNLPHKQLFFRSAKQLIDSMIKQKQILTLMLGLIGSISLIVGGIGVMNIMLVSVVERRREIGIRKAVGAKERDIQLLFLMESVTLSLFGGILGIITGVLASYIIALFAHWDFTLFLLPPIVGFSVSVAIGVFFGYYPAYQAAKLDPIQTLRSE